jgi:hypothetical protein
MLSQDAQKGRSARPQRAKRRGVPLRYVEPLSDARTMLTGFFSILLLKHEIDAHGPQMDIGMVCPVHGGADDVTGNRP